MTLRRARSRADSQAVLGEFGVAVDVDDPIDLDHGGGRESAGPGHGCRGGWWSGRARAAHAQIVEVFGAQVRGHGLDQLAVDEDVDGVLVDPDVRALAAVPRTHADALHRWHDRRAARWRR